MYLILNSHSVPTNMGTTFHTIEIASNSKYLDIGSLSNYGRPSSSHSSFSISRGARKKQ